MGLLLTLGCALRLRDEENEDELTEAELQEALNIRLPGYKYCGPGNDLLTQITYWRNNAPINQLDLACFYHDLVYANARSSPQDIREADLLVMIRAKDILNSLGGRAMSKLKYKAELQVVIKSFQGKIALEKKGLFNPLSLISKDPKRISKIRAVLKKNNLPNAWGLPYSY